MLAPDQPGCAGTAARLPNCPGSQKLMPPSSASEGFDAHATAATATTAADKRIRRERLQPIISDTDLPMISHTASLSRLQDKARVPEESSQSCPEGPSWVHRQLPFRTCRAAKCKVNFVRPAKQRR